MRAVQRPLTKALSALVTACAAAGIVPCATLAAQAGDEASTASPGVLVDRIVAVVDEDPILDSDLDRAIGLELVSRAGAESEHEFRRRVLDLMIDERLRAHEVDRFGFTEISLAEVDRAVGEVKARFASEAAFRARLDELGLAFDDVRQMVARQVMILTYVDERLGPKVFVSLDDIRAYYDGALADEMKRRGRSLPPLADVREEIRQVLREQRLNAEILSWTEELRREADVEDHFESDREAPADVVLGVERADGSSG